MNEKEFTERYGEEAFKEEQLRRWEWYENYRKRENALKKKYREAHPEEIRARNRERNKKGGKYYEKRLEYQRAGLAGKRNRIRGNHNYKWRPYKNIIAPLSQIHHEWMQGTADYRGVALVKPPGICTDLLM